MDEITVDGGSSDTGAVEGQETTEVTTQEPTQDEPAAPEAGAEEVTPEASDDEALESVKDDNGEEFIPKKAFAARIAKLTAQKHNAVNDALKTILSDPEALEMIRKASGDPSQASDEAATMDPVEKNLPVLSWLDKHGVTDPASRAGNIAFVDAIGETLLPQLRAMVDEHFAPVMKYIGKQEVGSFVASHPDAKANLPELQKMISSGRARNLQDAYALAMFGKKVQGAGAAAVKANTARQAKINATPIRRAVGNQVDTTGKPNTFAEAFAMAQKRLGVSR